MNKAELLESFKKQLEQAREAKLALAAKENQLMGAIYALEQLTPFSNLAQRNGELMESVPQDSGIAR